MSTASFSETLIWPPVQLQHPADWELLRYSRNPGKGRLMLADERGFRCEVSWVRLAEPLSTESLAREMMERAQEKKRAAAEQLEREKKQADGQIEPSAPATGNRAENTAPLQDEAAWLEYDEWRGWRSAESWGTATHAVRLFEQPCLLVEVTLLWREEPDVELERALIQSVTAVEVSADQTGPRGYLHWRALGLDVTFPEGAQLKRCEARSSSVTLELESHCGSQLKLERLALCNHWLPEGGVEEWLREEFGREHGKKVELILDDRSAAQHTLWTARGGKKSAARTVWLCPRSQRLYAITERPRKSRWLWKKPDPTPVRFCCCEQFALETT